MEGNRRRRVAAVAFVLAVGAGVVWTLAALNAVDAPVPAVGSVETGPFEFGGPTIGVGALAVGTVLLAAAVVLWRRSARDAGRAPTPPRRR